MIYLLLFAIGFALDVTWTLCVQSVADRHPWRAAAAQAGHTGLALAATWIVIANESPTGAVFYVLGCVVATFLVVRFRRRR